MSRATLGWTTTLALDELRAFRRRGSVRAIRRLELKRLRAITDATAGLAHDVNNLLMVVRSYTEFVTAGPLSRSQREDLTFALDAAHRGGVLTKQMLELCRQQSAPPLTCELSEAVRNLAELLSGALSGGVRLESCVQQAPLWIRCAPGQVDRIILNLVLNARDAMPDGGEITIGLERTLVKQEEAGSGLLPPGPYAVLTVADTGGGVPPELLGRIFETRFTTKPEGRGSGLGLAVVRETVNALGGSLGIESELGEGTKFSIYLPLASSVELPLASSVELPLASGVESAKASTSRPAVRQARPALPAEVEFARRLTVLVVEDDVLLRDSIVRVLREADLDARGVTGAMPALEILANGGIDVIVAEQSMSGMDGTSFFELAYARFPGISRILLTNPAPECVILAAIKRGRVDKVLLKNMHPVAIRDSIAEVASHTFRQRRAGARAR